MFPRSLRWPVSAALLCGAFAAQALWQDDNAPASADLIDSLTAGVATCPELAPQLRELLDQQNGILDQASAREALVQTNACHSQRKHIGTQNHTRLAYAALQDVLQAQPSDLKPQPQALRLSMSLGRGQ